MKKNITINLCGRLFAIDEDAYEMLATYEQSLRNYFRTREGGEEIANDIEARIAELFDELKQNGTEAVTIEHVTEIIHRIGKPEEMEEVTPHSAPEGATDASYANNNTTEAPSGAVGGAKASKRLYRNPDDKKVLGVLSGFAAYFGGDVLWWRLAYAAAVLLSFAGSWYNFLWFLPHHYLYFQIYFWGIALIIAYILLAVLMPVAETPEDRLRMKGKEVNPQNLAEEVVNSASIAPLSAPEGATDASYSNSNSTEAPSGAVRGADSSSSSWGKGHRGPSGCIGGTLGCIGGFFTAIWAVITFLFRWCIYAFGVFVAVMCLIGIFCLFVIAFGPISHVFGSSFMESPEFAALLPSLKVPFIVFFVSAVLVLAITAYAIIHSLLNEFKQMPPMPYRQRIFLLVIWIGGLIVTGSALASRWMQWIDAENEYNERVWAEYNARDRKENTHDGIYVKPDEWEFLQENGWQIINTYGCNDRYTSAGEHPTGDYDVRYLDCYDDRHRQRYRVERTDTLQPGAYMLTCAARADGTGAFIYAIVGDQQPQFKEIPATGNTGGSIWKTANELEDSLEVYLSIDPDSPYKYEYEHACAIRDANDGEGFGWNRIAFEPIRITKPTALRYGLTSDNAFTHSTWLGHWFSATDFEVSRIDDSE